MVNYVAGKFYKITKEDEQLIKTFPRLTLNTVFEALTIDEEHAVTRVRLYDGVVIDVRDDADDNYWCLFNPVCQESVEVAGFATMKAGLYQGHPIADQLEEIADELNYYNGSLALHAADYIRVLEKRLALYDKGF